ncbi:MAG TPA: hypothetical protein DCP32_14190 [Anaerolineaceae bacterium]|nr:MAG: hypothetical protein A2X24_05090 [Chloroflexi bacterium GWB2_54_36]HAL17842.1 hypothetical protein [Anaerolineaceae bacterium]HBA92101.1 hypothetical protein [Anaerolineaceae bacterium]
MSCEQKDWRYAPATKPDQPSRREMTPNLSTHQSPDWSNVQKGWKSGKFAKTYFSAAYSVG